MIITTVAALLLSPTIPGQYRHRPRPTGPAMRGSRSTGCDLPNTDLIEQVQRLMRAASARSKARTWRRFAFDVNYAVQLDAAGNATRIVVEDIGCRPVELLVGHVAARIVRDGHVRTSAAGRSRVITRTGSTSTSGEPERRAARSLRAAYRSQGDRRRRPGGAARRPCRGDRRRRDRRAGPALSRRGGRRPDPADRRRSRSSLDNLQRQVLFGTDDVGAGKAEVAARNLARRSIRHRGSKPLRERLDADNADRLLGGVDLVLDGSDNFATRLAVSDWCTAHARPARLGRDRPVPGADRHLPRLGGGQALLSLLRRRRVRRRGLRHLLRARRARRDDGNRGKLGGAGGDPGDRPASAAIRPASCMSSTGWRRGCGRSGSSRTRPARRGVPRRRAKNEGSATPLNQSGGGPRKPGPRGDPRAQAAV